MRVALYHNLPPGGALRVVREFARRASPHVDLDLYTLDFGSAGPFAYSNAYDSQQAPAEISGRHVVQRVDPGPLVRVAGPRSARVDWLQSVRNAEHSVARQINSRAYDVAYVHSCWYSHSPSLLRDLDVPSVYYMQEVRRATFEPGYIQPRRGLRSVPAAAADTIVERTLRHRDRRAVPAADLILCNSVYSESTITRAYGRPARVVHLGVDDATFAPGRAKPRDRTAHVVSVGGLEAFKGHHLIVEALALLPPATRPALHLVYERCDPGYRETLRRGAAGAGVTLVEHQGVSDQHVANLFRTSAATVLAAQLEPFGLVALESLASGTPVVAFDEGGYRETVTDGVNGFLVNRNVAALAKGVADVLRGRITATAHELRSTVIPKWGWDSSVAKQLDSLSLAARLDKR